MVKMFKVYGDKPGFSIIGIYKDEHTDVILQTYYDSRAPYLEELKKVLEVTGLWERGLNLNSKRKNPYKIEEKDRTSGCRDYYITYAEPIFEDVLVNKAFRIKQTLVLQVSMNNQLNKQTYAWLGDIVAVLETLKLDTTKIIVKELKIYNLNQLLELGFKLPNKEM